MNRKHTKTEKIVGTVPRIVDTLKYLRGQVDTLITDINKYRSDVMESERAAFEKELERQRIGAEYISTRTMYFDDRYNDIKTVIKVLQKSHKTQHSELIKRLRQLLKDTAP